MARTIIFTDEGQIIFQYKQSADNKDFFFYQDGMVFLNGKVFDLSGKELLPGIANICGWDEENQLFEQTTSMDPLFNSYNTVGYYTKDGKKIATSRCI